LALPFWMKEQQIGVFFLRTTGDDPPLTRADAQSCRPAQSALALGRERGTAAARSSD